MSERTVVVIGNGMVGHRLVEELVGRDAGRRLRLVVFGAEPRAAYDRVHLSDFFSGRDAGALALATPAWYAEHGVALRLGDPVVSIDRDGRRVRSASGREEAYDALVLATGSVPFVPPVPGSEKRGVHLYRTIEDVEAIRAAGATARRAVVIGGGLLGLEAARATRDMGLETHVVEVMRRLMPRQLDERGAAALARRIEALGVTLHLGAVIEAFVGDGAVQGLRLRDGTTLDADLVLISAGIRPADGLARAAGLECAERGGVCVDDALRTSDPAIFALGEVASHRGQVYGLVGPGYAMASVLAHELTRDAEEPARTFPGADLSTRLKLLGVDVASLGDPFAGGDAAPAIVLEDGSRDVYARIVLTPDRARVAGAMLVGDTSAYPRIAEALRSGASVGERPEALLFGAASGPAGAGAEDPLALPGDTLVCSCNGVDKAGLCRAIAEADLADVAAVKRATRAGTGCGGCLPLVSQLLAAQRAAAGRTVSRALCEHFACTRQELFQIAKLTRARSFETLLARHGRGAGCEICKPAVASILASLWNEPIQEQPTIQDTNDRFLANIQRGGTYSVVPRVPGGEITPEKLVVLGQVAARYGLYCKITGGQRIDLLGARVDQLPDIWRELVAAGFESGHAYGKAMRTVKSCVGTTWCRYGVQDSTALAIRLEHRYKGLRAPHKLKAAVSGCVRECAEAQSKDFGVIATERGWNLYVCGNGGAKPRHAELLATDVDEETLVRLVDRFLGYYIQTADRLTRTARWLEELPGGIARLREIVVDDALGIAGELERWIQSLVDAYACEWKQVVDDPALARRFRHFANDAQPDDVLRFVGERGQRRPADWERACALPAVSESAVAATGAEAPSRWVPLASTSEVPRDGGIAVRYGNVQLALFHVAATDAWYATQNACPHTGDMVLARGLVGDEGGAPKVACPQHKKTFRLDAGEGLSDLALRIAAFPVRVEDGKILVRLPPAEALEERLAATRGCARACPGTRSEGAR